MQNVLKYDVNKYTVMKFDFMKYDVMKEMHTALRMCTYAEKMTFLGKDD